MRKSEERFICHVRRHAVAATPEEAVRQQLLSLMVEELGFPSSLIAIEKKLELFPHINTKERLPDRRADIVCLAPNIHKSHALYPLLVIECKAIPLNSKVLNQVVGYNHFLGAWFIAVANQNEIKFGWRSDRPGEYTYINRLPAYSELIAKIQSLV